VTSPYPPIIWLFLCIFERPTISIFFCCCGRKKTKVKKHPYPPPGDISIYQNLYLVSRWFVIVPLGNPSRESLRKVFGFWGVAEANPRKVSQNSREPFFSKALTWVACKFSIISPLSPSIDVYHDGIPWCFCLYPINVHYIVSYI